MGDFHPRRPSNGQDSLDRLLARLPCEMPEADLALRIMRSIQVRQRWRIQAQVSACAFLAVIGVWLVVPEMASWLQSLSLPSTGLAVLLGWVEIALGDARAILDGFLSGLSSLQGTLLPLDLSSWPGLASLAVSALLLLDLLIPKENRT